MEQQEDEESFLLTRFILPNDAVTKSVLARQGCQKDEAQFLPLRTVETHTLSRALDKGREKLNGKVHRFDMKERDDVKRNIGRKEVGKRPLALT